MPQAWSAVIATPLPEGWCFAIRCHDAGVYETAFLPPATPLQQANSKCALAAVKAAQRYFQSAMDDVPLLRLHGTVFQQRVWHALRLIPAGQPLTYGQLASRLGSSARAVAGACRANPVPLFVPCHRVVAAHGPGGFMGATAGPAIHLKNWLLDHELQR